jgi:hypothetical protein
MTIVLVSVWFPDLLWLVPRSSKTDVELSVISRSNQSTKFVTPYFNSDFEFSCEIHGFVVL